MKNVLLALSTVTLLCSCGYERDNSPNPVIIVTPVPTPYYAPTYQSPYEPNYNTPVIYVTPVPTVQPMPNANPVIVTQVNSTNTQQVVTNRMNPHSTIQNSRLCCFNGQQNYNPHLPHRYPQYTGQVHCTLAQAYQLSNPGYQYNPYMTGWNGGYNSYNTGIYGQYTNGNSGFPGLNNQHNGRGRR